MKTKYEKTKLEVDLRVLWKLILNKYVHRKSLKHAYHQNWLNCTRWWGCWLKDVGFSELELCYKRWVCGLTFEKCLGEKSPQGGLALLGAVKRISIRRDDSSKMLSWAILEPEKYVLHPRRCSSKEMFHAFDSHLSLNSYPSPVTGQYNMRLTVWVKF